MKQVLTLLITSLLFGCSQELLTNCNAKNYFKSHSKNLNTGFKNQQREVFTSFSEKELESFFNETSIRYKDILSEFFYCNICFNNDINYLVSYSGKRFDLVKTKDPNIFIHNLMNLISTMQMGAEEYEYFLNSQNLNK